ncbi:MAG: hypothetical protein WBC05_08790 [Sedimentisphaerales bacterium]
MVPVRIIKGQMMKRAMLTTMIIITAFGLAGSAQAAELSIYEIQYTADPNGASGRHGSIVDCLGGIVTHKPPTGRPRLIIQDPNYPDGWGAIQVKDLYSTGVFIDVNIGDWVSFANVEIEDNKGTTFLQYIEANNANFMIVSTNNLLPEPLVVTVDEIAAPVEGLDTWFVAGRNAEKYEAMLVKVTDISVQDTGYGKAYDNYILASNVDPNLTCWASDYMNAGKDKGLIYHPNIEPGRNFCGVTGILEQYTGEQEGISYDYYQLLTTSTEDFVIDQVADLDDDCDVDFADFGIFAGHWLDTGGGEPDFCGGADLATDQADGIVNAFDLLEFARHWLEGK